MSAKAWQTGQGPTCRSAPPPTGIAATPRSLLLAGPDDVNQILPLELPHSRAVEYLTQGNIETPC